jgi:hypothetical protein
MGFADSLGRTNDQERADMGEVFATFARKYFHVSSK